MLAKILKYMFKDIFPWFFRVFVLNSQSVGKIAVFPTFDA